VIFVDRENISSRDAATSPEPSQRDLQEEHPFREKLVSDIGVAKRFPTTCHGGACGGEGEEV
jgi:hypothetical protein